MHVLSLSSHASETRSALIVFDTETFSGSPNFGDLVSFNGTFNYNPGLGDLLVDIQRVFGSAEGVGLDANSNPGLTDRAYSRTSSVTADIGGVNDGGYADRTQFELSPISKVPEPGSTTLLGSGLLVVGFFGRRKRKAL
jgi:hypothetical protein